MRRKALDDLALWLKSHERKPLILRGARQVGKTTLVRLFSKAHNLDLIEINLETQKLNSASLDKDFEIQSLLDEIQFKKKKKIHEKSLIFFDEIQNSPTLLKVLRYFYEQRPEIKVIATGSLLEIALSEKNFSFPVGRVEFYHLTPMTFQEFLWATDQDLLDEKLISFDFSPELHSSALKALKDYYYVGGMPASVKRFSETKSFLEIRKIQEEILQAYELDFPKYQPRLNVERISRVFHNMALSVGKKVIYSKIDSESQTREIKKCVNLLMQARVILPCFHSEANTSPLLGESDPKIFKTYFLDIGLLNALLKLDFETIDNEFSHDFNTKGFLAEQYVAQHLSLFEKASSPPSLIYHLRDKGSQKAEVDFLIEHKNKIFPLEVKSTSSGHLKSLKYFVESKKSDLCIRTCLQPFSVKNNFVQNTKLITLPLYAIGYLKESEILI